MTSISRCSGSVVVVEVVAVLCCSAVAVVYLSVHQSVYIYIYIHIYTSVCVCGYLFVFLFIDLSIYSSIYPSIYLSICKFENEAILRDFLIFLNLTTSKTKQFCETSNFYTWQHQTRSDSARLPQCLKLATSKTKQFCETSFKNGKLSAELTASYQCVLRFFHSICLKCCACQEKLMPDHTKCCTCHAKSSSQNWRSYAPKCNPSPEISALTS